MQADFPTLVFLTTVYFVAASVFLYLYTLLRRHYFLLWTTGWLCLVVWSLARITLLRDSTSMGLDPRAAAAFENWVEAIGGYFLLIGVLVTLAGVYHFLRQSPPTEIIAWIAAPLLLFTIVGPLGLDTFMITLGLYLFITLATCWIGVLFLYRWTEARTFGLGLLGAGFFFWGFLRLLYPFAFYLDQFEPLRPKLPQFVLLAEVPFALIVFSMTIVVALEEIREELANSEIRFRQFFEGASDPIFLVDPDTGRIHDVNPRGCKLLGYRREELLGMTVQDLAAPEQGTSPAGLLSKLRPRTAGPGTVQTHHRHRDGRLIPISLTRSLIKVGGRDLLLVHTRDISDLRHQEMQLASRISQLQAVQRVSTVLTRTLSTDELCSLLYDNIQGLFVLDFFAMDALDDRTNRLENLATMHMVNGVMTRVPPGPAGGGLAEADLQHLLAEREARLETRKQSRISDAADFPDCCLSLAVVPMVAGDESVGMLCAGSLVGRAFDGSQLDLLQHIASIAGIALKNAQLYEFQQQQVRRQKFLADMGPSLITNLDALHAASLVAANMKNFLDLTDIEIWLVSDELSSGALYRAYPSGRPASISLSSSKNNTPTHFDIVTACLSSGLAIVENDCRESRLIPETWVQDRGLKSCMAMPIMVGDRAVGVIRLDDSRRYGRFRPDDTEFVKLVAQIMASALEAARLFQQVRNSEQRFSQLVEASSVGIVILRERMLDFANSYFQEMLELAETPINSLSIFELIPSEFEPQWRRAIEACEEGREQRIEGWMQRSNGSRIWCEIIMTMIDYGGVRAVQLLVDDVTEKRAAQTQRQNDMRVRSIGTLTAGIGQDFQSLFSAILGHVAFLKMQGIGDETSERSILAVEAAILRAMDFTRQLMNFAETSESGIQPTDVNTLIIQASKLFEGILPERPRMKFDLAPNLPKVRGNEEQLRQALLNLLLAISERAGDGNTIVVQSISEVLAEDRVRNSSELEVGPYVTVLVSERRGVIDAQTAEALLTSSGTSVGRGALGMSVLMSTVRTHQGCIEVRRGGTATSIALMLPVDSGVPTTPGARLLSGTLTPMPME